MGRVCVCVCVCGEGGREGGAEEGVGGGGGGWWCGHVVSRRCLFICQCTNPFSLYVQPVPISLFPTKAGSRLTQCKPHSTQPEEKDCEVHLPLSPVLREAIFSIVSTLDALDPDHELEYSGVSSWLDGPVSQSYFYNPDCEILERRSECKEPDRNHYTFKVRERVHRQRLGRTSYDVQEHKWRSCAVEKCNTHSMVKNTANSKFEFC